jgi:hypothetical protein
MPKPKAITIPLKILYPWFLLAFIWVFLKISPPANLCEISIFLLLISGIGYGGVELWKSSYTPYGQNTRKSHIYRSSIFVLEAIFRLAVIASCLCVIPGSVIFTIFCLIGFVFGMK